MKISCEEHFIFVLNNQVEYIASDEPIIISHKFIKCQESSP